MKKMSKILLCLFSILLLFNSCDTYKIASRHIDAKMANADLRYYELKTSDYTITYWDNNNKKPVLILLHGFGATTEFQWYKQVKKLGENFRIVMPNLLYFGSSDAAQKGYKIADQVQFVNRLTDTLNIRYFSVCGISYGALVAAEYVDMYPDKVNKLIITDGPVKFFSDRDINEINKNFDVDNISDLLLPDNPKEFKKLLDIVYYKHPYVPDFVLKNLYTNLYSYDKNDQTQLLKHLDDEKEYYNLKEYKNLNLPILLVWGNNDNLIPKHIGEELNAYFGEKSNLVLLNKTAHLPNFEKPGTYTKIITDFLLED